MKLETSEISATLHNLADAYRFAAHHCELLRQAAERLNEQSAQLEALRGDFIADCLRDYANALTTGELDGAGRYVPADVIEAAGVIESAT